MGVNIKKLITAALVIATLLGVSGCVPEHPIQIFGGETLKPIDKSTLTPEEQSKPNRFVNKTETPTAPNCLPLGFDDCDVKTLYYQVLYASPVTQRSNRTRQLEYAGVAVTLLGDSASQNDFTALGDMISVIKAADSNEQFQCFQNQMLRWVVEDANSQMYLQAATMAFGQGVPELTSYIMSAGVPSDPGRFAYGTEDQRKRPPSKPVDMIKDLAKDQVWDQILGSGGEPSASGAVEAWIKAYSIAMKQGVQLNAHEAATALSAKFMVCQTAS